MYRRGTFDCALNALNPYFKLKYIKTYAMTFCRSYASKDLS